MGLLQTGGQTKETDEMGVEHSSRRRNVLLSNCAGGESTTTVFTLYLYIYRERANTIVSGNAW